jgi:hypothetical protein
MIVLRNELVYQVLFGEAESLDQEMRSGMLFDVSLGKFR